MKVKLSYFLLQTILVFVLSTFHTDCWSQDVQIEKVNNYITTLMKRDSIPGMAVTVIKNGQTVFESYKGYANLEQASLVKKESVFQIASVSKQFTATAVMILAERGKISLNARVSAYLPDVPIGWDGITISNLLSHSSGLMNYEDIPGFTEKAYLDSAHSIVLKSTLRDLYRQKLRFSPGTKSEYCNSNYFVLGAIIEKVTKTNFEDFLNSQILSPLQMQHTQINEMYHIVKNRVTGYTTVNNQLINADRLGMDWFFAEGNIITTMADLEKWARLTDNELLLKRQTIDRMLSAQKLSDGVAGKFGYGWFIDKTPGVVYHSGHTPGFSAFTYRNALKKTKILLLMNNDNIPTAKLLDITKAIDDAF